jgi:cytochrome c peroxidase
MKQYRLYITLLFIVLSGIAWVQADNWWGPVHPVKFNTPKGWPAPAYDFAANPLTKEGIALGKQLFYDGILSKDGMVSCGTCHQSFGGFATYDHSLSHGIDNRFSTRNAPGIVNMAWQKNFMWDGGILHLDLQPLAPITAENEMGETLDSVLHKLNSHADYRKKFQQAFRVQKITTLELGKAISQFVLTLVSNNSKYDRVMRGEDTFILPEQLGYEMFQQKCITCHPPPFFTDFSFRNAGLAEDEVLQDKGRMRITGKTTDSLKFKVPSLRNVGISFPYGHDGRWATLRNVFEHYRSKQPRPMGTDSLLKNGIPLSNYEIGQLTAFLYTLTDSTLIANPAFLPEELNRLQKQERDIHQNKRD